MGHGDYQWYGVYLLQCFHHVLYLLHVCIIVDWVLMFYLFFRYWLGHGDYQWYGVFLLQCDYHVLYLLHVCIIVDWV